ncbi:MAG: GAF domain-containing protein [Chloroflexia bacterium]
MMPPAQDPAERANSPALALGDALLREPDLGQGLRRLYRELTTAIPAEYLYTGVLDTRSEQLVIPLYYENGEYTAGYSRPFQAGGGPAEWVLAHDAALISGNFPVEAAARNWPSADPDLPFLPLSVMVMPLRLGGRAIGVISIGSSRPDAYGSPETALLSYAADLLAGVLAQWWSDLRWTREQALALTEAETLSRHRQEVFSRIAWRSTLETNPALLLNTALHEIGTLVPWDAAGIWQEHQAWPGLARIWHEAILTAIPGRSLPADGPLAAAAHECRRTVLLSPDPADHTAGTGPRGPAVAVSLRYSAAQAPGLLVLERAPGAEPFSAEDAALLEQLGQALTVGIEKCRRMAPAALHRDLAAALQGDPATVWAAVGAALQAHLPSGAAAVLVQADGRWHPLTPPTAQSPFWYDTAPGLPAAAMTGGRPQVYRAAAIAEQHITGIGSLVIVPIIAAGVPLGVVAFWSAQAHAVGGAEVEILDNAAAHLAPILWAERAGVPVTQDVYLPAELGALQQAAGESVDLPGLLHSVLRYALASTPAVAGTVLLREAGDRLALRASVPERAGSPLPSALYETAARVLKRGQAEYFSGTDGAVACIPLSPQSVGGKAPAPLGVLVFNSDRPDAFRPADREMLGQLAAPATAWVSQRAVADAERAIYRMAGVHASGTQVLERVPALICQALFVPVCLVHWLDRRSNRFVVASAAGFSVADPALTALELAGDDPRLPALFTAQPDRRRPVRAADAPFWPPALLAAAGLHLQCVVPFSVDGQPAGLISVHTFDDAPAARVAVGPLAGLAAALGDTLVSLRQGWRVGTLTALTEGVAPNEAELLGPTDLALTPRMAGQLTHLLTHALDLTGMKAAYLLLRSDGHLPLAPVVTVGATRTALPESLAPHLALLLEVAGPYYLPDTRPDPPPGYPLFDAATRSSILLPLRAEGTPNTAACLGLIVLESPTPHTAAPTDFQAVQPAAALALAIICQGGLLQQLGSQPGQLDQVLAAIDALWDEQDESIVQARLVAAARTALDADLVVLYPGGQGQAAGEVPPQSGNQQPGALAGGPEMQALVEQATARAGLVFVEDVTARGDLAANVWAGQERVQALVIAPLPIRARQPAVLLAAYRRPVHFDAARRQTVRLFSSLAALVLANARSRAQASVQAAAQMQSFSLAAHELREPVEKVHMILETALNGLWLPMSDTLRSRIGVAYNVLDDYSESLDRVLQLGRLQAGVQELERRPAAVGELAHAVIARHAEYARERDVTLQASVDPLLAPQRPLLDEVLLRVALSNLVHNAVKFSRPGGMVNLGCTSGYSDGQRYLIWTVEDQGIGIPATAQDQIFDPYYQVAQGLGRPAGGPGLGLALARLIVELHGGTIAVAGAPGAGSRFTVRLPFLAA